MKGENGFSDPAYAALGVWDNTLVSRVAPNEVAFSRSGSVMKVTHFPKGVRYVASTFHNRSNTFAMLVRDPDDKAYVCMMRPKDFTAKLYPLRNKELADSIDFDRAGQIVLLNLKKEKAVVPGSSELLIVDPKTGAVTKRIGGFDICPGAYKSFSVLRDANVALVLGCEKTGWLVHLN